MANKIKKSASGMLDFSNSTNIIKKTAKSINAQVQEVVSEVAEDLKENGVTVADKAIAPVKKAYNKVTDNINWEYLDLAKATKSVNDYALNTAEEIVDGVVVNGEKWQGVAEKAINGGLKMAAKQQETVFDTMETVKGQLATGSKRLQKLLSSK